MHFFAYKWISFRLLKFGIRQKRNVLHDWQVFDAFRKQRVVQWDIPLCVYTGLAFFRRLWTLPGRDSSLLLCPLKKFHSFILLIKSLLQIYMYVFWYRRKSTASLSYTSEIDARVEWNFVYTWKTYLEEYCP